MSVSNQHIRYLADDEWQSALEILREASLWAERFGSPAWSPDELTEARQRESAEARELIGGFENAEMAACMRLERSDPIHWPEDKPGDALYLHKLAVQRAYAGHGWARRMIDWCASECRNRNVRSLRLDTVPDTKLPSLYAELGFRLVDEAPQLFVGRRLVRMELIVPSSGEPSTRQARCKEQR